MRLFDAHCHPQMPQYDADREAVLARMQEREVGGIVVGTDYEMSKAGIELARTHDFLWASVGCHPNHEEEFDVARYEELAKDTKVVAIGECGLDYFRSEKGNQEERFLAHIELAKKMNKALIIHCREAHDDCLSILQKARTSGLEVPVIMHFFTADKELAQKYLDLGCYLSFPGPITFTDMYDDSIRIVPTDKMLIETDSPFASPAPYRGKRNEPAYVEEVARKIAMIKSMNIEEVFTTTLGNAKKAFSLQ